MGQPARNIDLHLLECFDLLMRERSVSRAAEHLGVSQSSASDMLARLRERFGDPLLVRTRDGLVPTPRAQELLPRVRSAAAHLVSQSDLVLVLPRQAAAALARSFALELVDVPLPLGLVEVSMDWHERTHHSGSHQWLRRQVREVLGGGREAPY